jgi:hypothetical protein
MTVDPEPADEPAHPPAMLASAADRERALDVLKAGFAEGRLNQAEHEERVARVCAARTYGELALLVADLPAGPLGSAAHHPVYRVYRVTGYPPNRLSAPAVINSFAVASLICGLVELPTLGLSALPAVILGNRARQQIRETGQRGEGLAVAGLILGWAALTVFFAAIVGLMIWLILPPGPGAGGPIGS